MANSVFLFPGSLQLGGSLGLPNFVPSITTNQLYNDGGTLKFNGSAIGGGTGDVVGPASAVSDAIARFSGTTGKLIKSSAVTIDDTTGILSILSDSGLFRLGASSDVILARDAANSLALRNGTNPQKFSVYNTFTSPTNFESFEILWSGNVVYIGTEKGSGGGSGRGITFLTGGAVRWNINGASGNLLGSVDNTYDFGNLGALRPRTGYFGTSVYSPLFSVLGSNSQELKMLQNTIQSGAMSGATLTLTSLIPAGSLVIGVTVHPTTAITSGDGSTTYNIGDGTDVDRWGAAIAFAADVKLTDATITTPPIYAAATNVVLTAIAGTFSGGVVRVSVHYLTVIPATS